MTSIVLVLARALSPASVLRDVLRRLEDDGVAAGASVLGPGEPLPAAAAEADLLVLRGSVHPDVLQCVEDQGLPSCNSVAATRRARHKGLTAQALARAGVPAPPTAVLHRWDEVRAACAGRAVVVKPVHGGQGRGVLFVDHASVPEQPPYPGPYIVQEPVDGDGVDRKLYVVGDHVAGVRRPWPASTLEAKRGEPFEPDEQLSGVARRAGAALGLDVFGVDAVMGSRGPAVVDVNAFPGFQGVPGAAERLAAYLGARARGPGSRCQAPG